MSLPSHVRLVEVGPRDGLQNEAQPISVADKVQLVDALSAAGLSYIEVGRFVSPKWVPQMAGSAEVFAQIQRKPGVTYGALAPNLRGFEDALAAGVKEVAVFAAASEAFSQRNINCSISESLERFVPIMAAAKEHGGVCAGMCPACWVARTKARSPRNRWRRSHGSCLPWAAMRCPWATPSAQAPQATRGGCLKS
ncbi:hydroxymethylglutaryl-CoA lyase [Pseudomonas fluorescens WH6]|nr:hydroxymethylglutaryl-CoA lyase [Pseudomonas fluorescens WH6]